LEIDFEFQKDRKIGDFVQDFIDLLKCIIGHFFGIMLQLTAIPLGLLLLVFYYLTTKISFYEGGSTTNEWGIMSILTVGVITLLVLGLYVYAIAIEYFLLLKTHKDLYFKAGHVFRNFLKSIGYYAQFLFAALIIAFFGAVPFLLVASAITVIPLVGVFGLGILTTLILLWFYIALMLYREHYSDLWSSFSKAFILIKNKLFDFGISGYIVNFIFQTLILLITLIPSIILAIIAYNTVGFEANFMAGVAGKILVSAGSTLLVIMVLCGWVLSALLYGLIYETAKELKYNERVYQQIAELGERNEKV